MLNTYVPCHIVTRSSAIEHDVCTLYASLRWNYNYSVPRITGISLPPELLYSESNLPPEVITAEFLIQFSLEMISCHCADLGSTQEYRDTCKGKL